MAKPSFIVDVNDLTERVVQEILRTLGEIWGIKLKDPLYQAITEQMHAIPASLAAMLDLKPTDTMGRIGGLMQRYARMCRPPSIVTISGSLPLQTLTAAVNNRDQIGVIATGPLSDWSSGYCLTEYGEDKPGLLIRWVQKGLRAGVQGMTCPGHLLEYLDRASLPEGFMVIATGIRSRGAPRHDHEDTITPEAALKWGAFPVIGREISAKPDPVEALRGLVARCRF